MEAMQSSMNSTSTGKPTDLEQASSSPEPRFKIVGLASQHIDRYWRFIEPVLAKVIEDHGHGELAIEQIKDHLDKREMQLWIVVENDLPKAYAVTRVIDYPLLRACRVVLLQGTDFDSWIATLLARLAPWARSLGCSRLEACGRSGWRRKLKRLGCQEAYSTVHLNLE